MDGHTMSLREALDASRPLPPTLQTAHKNMDGKRILSVAFDGRFWDLLYGGSPFNFDTLPELEEFLGEEGITLEEGWLPQPQG